MQVQLVTPEQVLYQGEASMVIARTLDGDLGILPGHAPVLGALRPGRVRVVKPDGSEEVVTVDSGFVEVIDDRVTILADAAQQGS
jgi:F-type H+-transporting ATPase subunit epsilon